MAKETQQSALQIALSQIEKQFGRGSIMWFADKPNSDVEVISTGCLSIDLAIGAGGIPRGRITELYGPLASGKSTLAVHIISETQKLDGTVAYVDAEHCISPEYFSALGVDIDKMLISQPDSAEQALSIVEILANSGDIALIVLDSVAALVPQAEVERDMDEWQQGLLARLMGKAMRKLVPVLARSNTALLCINQLREKIGVTYGDPSVTPGGKALGYAASLRLDIRRIGSIKSGEDTIGARTKVKTAKNKMSPPFKETEVDLIFGHGICKYGDLLDLAVQHKLVTKSGAWYSMGGEQIGQGRENAKQFLKDSPELFEDLKQKVRAATGS